MASRKTQSNLAAAIHAWVYTLPFLILVPMSFEGYVVIALTHYLIDRYRLARWWCSLVGIGTKGLWEKNDPNTPPFLSVWLMIIVDNTFHLIINYLSWKVFGDFIS